jgi:hypothetical protein
MNKIVLSLVAFLMLSFSVFAQNNLKLNINHKLGTTAFAMNTAAQNNMTNDFKVNRLEYYISEISITHDGGTETMINNIYTLVNASGTTNIDLGSQNITAVEGVNFYIGVDANSNHADPASYNMNHALAPKNPSMHWGWTAGYRFLAIEGKGGSNFNQTFELHGLGDANYFKVIIPFTTAVTAVNNETILEIDADYTRILENIAVNSGVIVHGETGAAKTALQNMSDYVFTPSSTVSSTVDFSEVSRFSVFPNPTTNGVTKLTITTSEEMTYQVAITDIVGRQVAFFNAVRSNTTLELNLDNAGLYFVSLIKEGQPIITEKLIVQ